MIVNALSGGGKSPKSSALSGDGFFGGSPGDGLVYSAHEQRGGGTTACNLL